MPSQREKMKGAASALFGNNTESTVAPKPKHEKKSEETVVTEKVPAATTTVKKAAPATKKSTTTKAVKAVTVPTVEKSKPGPKAVLPADFEKKVYSLDPSVVKKIKGYAAMNDLNESILVNEILETYISKKMG